MKFDDYGFCYYNYNPNNDYLFSLKLNKLLELDQKLYEIKLGILNLNNLDILQFLEKSINYYDEISRMYAKDYPKYIVELLLRRAKYSNLYLKIKQIQDIGTSERVKQIINNP